MQVPFHVTLATAEPQRGQLPGPPPNQKPGSRTPQSQPPRAQSRDSRDATRLLLIRPLRVFAIAIAFHLAQATGSSKHRSETPVTALLLPHTLVFAIRKGKKKQSLDRKPRDDRPRPPAMSELESTPTGGETAAPQPDTRDGRGDERGGAGGGGVGAGGAAELRELPDEPRRVAPGGA